ncbi:MAG: acyl dehydratase [Gammaproteobacteria bacterium]|jgi:acyl dehydratase
MSISKISEVEFGEELPSFSPDTSLDNVRRFCAAAGWHGPRFNSHEEARKLGLPGAIVPGIMSQGFLAAMIHRWAPDSTIEKIDTVFRAPVLVDQAHTITAVVTDINEDTSVVETDLTVTNEAGETRVFGTATIRI